MTHERLMLMGKQRHDLLQSFFSSDVGIGGHAQCTSVLVHRLLLMGKPHQIRNESYENPWGYLVKFNQDQWNLIKI